MKNCVQIEGFVRFVYYLVNNSVSTLYLPSLFVYFFVCLFAF